MKLGDVIEVETIELAPDEKPLPASLPMPEIAPHEEPLVPA